MTSTQRERKRDRDRSINAMLREREPIVHALLLPNQPKRQYRKIQSQFLALEASRLWAACRVLGDDATDVEIRALADSLDPYESTGETVEWSRTAKTSGRGYRFICRLPPILKGNHYLISDLLRAALPPSDHLYDREGRGTAAAIEDIKNALEGGYDWCWYGDLRDCFQSVSADTLTSRLPLPRAVVRSNLDYRHLIFEETTMPGLSPLFVGSNMGEDARRCRPCGLLQGSPTSNLALAMLFSDMACAFALHECVPCVFADNIFIAAKSKAELEVVVAKVRAYFRAHPAGRFRLHKEGWVAPRQSFVIFGCEFTFHDGEWQLAPHYAGQEKMFGKLDRAEELDQARADGTIQRTEAVAEGYRGAYHYWREVDEFIDSALHRSAAFTKTATLAKQNLAGRDQKTGEGKPS